MKSYIKIYGPPMMKALEALRGIAVDMPEVCVMDPSIEAAIGLGAFEGVPGVSSTIAEGILDTSQVIKLFGGPDKISEERCDTIISKSGESLGEYDFYFEWFQKPTMAQVEDLINRIDKALEPLGVRYTITTK